VKKKRVNTEKSTGGKWCQFPFGKKTPPIDVGFKVFGMGEDGKRERWIKQESMKR